MKIVKVYSSTVINASVESLWRTIRNFNNIVLWHPDVKDSLIEDGRSGDQIGAVRALHLQNDALIRERLLELSDVNFSYTYSVIEAPFVLENHRSTVKLFPVTTTNQAFVTWEAQFSVKDEEAEIMAEGVLTGVILPGFEGLNALAQKEGKEL